MCIQKLRVDEAKSSLEEAYEFKASMLKNKSEFEAKMLRRKPRIKVDKPTLGL